tara:strand:- start:11885 stop:12145 length:261 start_codon:yes stop_codon:yes gene_type:complete
MNEPKPILVIYLEDILNPDERLDLLKSLEPISQDYHLLLLENQVTTGERDIEMEILKISDMDPQKLKDLEEKILEIMEALKTESDV